MGITLYVPEEGARSVAKTPNFCKVHRSSKKSPKQASSAKRRKKCPDNLIFGVGVSMEQAKSYSETVVVDRAQGRNPGLSFLKKWVKEH